MRSALDIAGDERFDYTHYILGDWSQYEHSHVHQEDVKTLIAIMKSICKICPNVKNAVVIRPDRSGNALVAFYKMLADDLPWDIEIFHSFEEAYQWFKLPLPEELSSRPLFDEIDFANTITASCEGSQKRL